MDNKKYELLLSSLEALRKKSINLLILKGEAGFGKSYTTLKYLEENKTDFVYFNSYSTPLKFYSLLYQNKDRDIIIFDDLQNIDNPIIISMLKGACWGLLKGQRTLSWYSTTDLLNKLDLPPSFDINARIILIFNDELKGFEPIINRGISIDFYFNFDEKIKILESLKPDEEILNYIKANCNEATNNLSIRTINILDKLKKDGFKWRLFAQEMLKTDEEKSLILELIKKHKKKENACNEWIALTGKSRATFFRYLNKI